MKVSIKGVERQMTSERFIISCEGIEVGTAELHKKFSSWEASAILRYKGIKVDMHNALKNPIIRQETLEKGVTASDRYVTSNGGSIMDVSWRRKFLVYTSYTQGNFGDSVYRIYDLMTINGENVAVVYCNDVEVAEIAYPLTIHNMLTCCDVYYKDEKHIVPCLSMILRNWARGFDSTVKVYKSVSKSTGKCLDKFILSKYNAGFRQNL